MSSQSVFPHPPVPVSVSPSAPHQLLQLSATHGASPNHSTTIESDKRTRRTRRQATGYLHINRSPYDPQPQFLSPDSVTAIITLLKSFSPEKPRVSLVLSPLPGSPVFYTVLEFYPASLHQLDSRWLLRLPYFVHRSPAAASWRLSLQLHSNECHP